jgi:hypothetical protein
MHVLLNNQEKSPVRSIGSMKSFKSIVERNNIGEMMIRLKKCKVSTEAANGNVN